MDNKVLTHVLFDQLEGRTNGPDNEFRWDGQAWVGTDMNKLRLKSEGFVNAGKMSDGVNFSETRRFVREPFCEISRIWFYRHDPTYWSSSNNLNETIGGSRSYYAIQRTRR
jgi:hypothetical protein